MLVDTHCHFARGKLREDLDGVLTRAADADVAAIVCATSDLPESKSAVRLARDYPHVYRLAGVHPHDAKDVDDACLAQIEDLAGGDKCVALGEIGLDYHYDFSPRDRQREAFAAQLDIAVRRGFRVVVHTREAFDDTMAILRESEVDGRRVIFHSFTGGPEQARRILAFGSAISFGGVVTFKNAEDNRQAALLTPADRILVETDAPFLSPEPVRRMKPNEPANVVHTARFLADLRGETFEALSAATTANAARLLGVTVPS